MAGSRDNGLTASSSESKKGFEDMEQDSVVQLYKNNYRKSVSRFGRRFGIPDAWQ